MSHIIDLTGQRFTHLVVLERAGSTRRGATLWRCQCDCGAICVVARPNLREGKTRSCGCLKHLATSHTTDGLHAPYGYLVSMTGVSIDEEKARCVRMIDALERDGLTQTAIARRMTSLFPRPSGYPWQIYHISQILADRHLYRGSQRGQSTETWPVILQYR